MKASTHTEVYRPFEGQLLTRPMRPAVLAWSGIRLGFRKKLPAFLLFTPPTVNAWPTPSWCTCATRWPSRWAVRAASEPSRPSPRSRICWETSPATSRSSPR